MTGYRPREAMELNDNPANKGSSTTSGKLQKRKDVQSRPVHEQAAAVAAAVAPAVAAAQPARPHRRRKLRLWLQL